MSNPELGGPLIDAGARGIGAGFRALSTAFRAAPAVAAETKAVSAAAQLAKNVEQGAKGEAITAAKLGDKVAGRQVTFKTSTGTKARTDFVTKDKGIVETKTGNAELSKGQQQLKSDVDAGREVTPVGQNAADAGLKPGEPTKMTSCTTDRVCP
ncbi:MAG: hypothetical protein WA213_19455 [Terriglobales bacterium]